jgi:hypothetical protein
MGLIAIVIAKDVLQVIVSIFGKINDSPSLVDMKDRESVAWLLIRTQVPCTPMEPMVVVAPRVDKPILGYGNAVYTATEHLLPVDQQAGLAYSIVIVAVLHVVIGPKSKAHTSPGSIRRLEIKDGGLCIAVKTTMGILRTGHKAMGARRNGVIDELGEELIGVKHIPRASIVNLKMQVGSSRRASIATECDELSLTDRTVERRQTGI